MIKKFVIYGLICLLALFASFSVYAGPIPDTGQTQCYDYAGNVITCPVPGEPLYGQDGNYSINFPSYTKLDVQGNPLLNNAASWTMVKDNVTGLIWEVKTDDGSIHDKDNTYTWYDSDPQTNGGYAGTPGNGTDTEDAIQAFNESNFGGYSDWRMPTYRELLGIANFNNQNPTINTTYFPNNLPSDYWSSTTFTGYESFLVWVVNFDYNAFGWMVYDGKVSKTNYFRAVRGPKSESSLVDNGDNTVTDLSTGLMWQRQSGEPMNWEDALAYCENLNLAGHSDWRLPSIKELRSIIDYSQYNPTINTMYFPDTVSSNYWSSTTYTTHKNSAWFVEFKQGQSVGNPKSSKTYYVRAVRGGQSAQAEDLDARKQVSYPGDPAEISWFVHISDSHIGRNEDAQTNLKWAVNDLNLEYVKPSFIVNTGDLTDSTDCEADFTIDCDPNLNKWGPLPDGPFIREWQDYYDIVSNAANYYDIPGNHDRYLDLNWDGETGFDGYKYMGLRGSQSQTPGAKSGTDEGTYSWMNNNNLYLAVNTNDEIGISWAAYELINVFTHEIISPLFGSDLPVLNESELNYIFNTLSNYRFSNRVNLSFVFGHHEIITQPKDSPFGSEINPGLFDDKGYVINYLSADSSWGDETLNLKDVSTFQVPEGNPITGWIMTVSGISRWDEFTYSGINRDQNMLTGVQGVFGLGAPENMVIVQRKDRGAGSLINFMDQYHVSAYLYGHTHTEENSVYFVNHPVKPPFSGPVVMRVFRFM